VKARVVFAEGEVVGLEGPRGRRYCLRETRGPRLSGAWVQYYRVSGTPWTLAYEERWNPERKRIETRAYFADDPAPCWSLCC